MSSPETYNLVVVGAGTAGLAAAIGAAELGARVALIEREAAFKPQLSVQSFANLAHEIARARKTSERYFAAPQVALDFPRVLATFLARSEAELQPSLELARAKGIDCFIGQGRFLDENTFEVEGKPLKFARALIATGSSVIKPEAPARNCFTSSDLLKINELPKSLTVIGSNSDAVAIAQSFARLGSKVALIDSADRLLSNYESRAAKIVTESLLRDGVQIELTSESISRKDFNNSDCIIFCSSRRSNIQSLNLDAAKVALEPDGRLYVNDKFQTTNPRIYACGGMISQEPSPHDSEAQARYVIGNALFLANHVQSELLAPRIVYSDPEIATVGFTPEDIAEESLEETVLDHPEQGYLRIVHNRKGDILGATIVAPLASELIGEIVLAINHQIKLGSLGSDIHPHGTLSDFIKQCGDLHHRKLLTPKLAKSLSRFMKWRR